MTTFDTAASRSAPAATAISVAARALSTTGRKIWRLLTRESAATYRPELHYMRGPGPKWREKHERAGLRPARGK
jgi:hypothetical protein